MMEKVQDKINKLTWNDYKDLWSKFWFQKLGYFPPKNKVEKVEKVVQIFTAEEARKKDEALEKEFLNFVAK